jgi:hypothetical protein
MYGFDTKVSDVNIPIKECKNLLSTVNQKDVVQELIEKEVQKGFLSGPYDKLPFDLGLQLQASVFGYFDKKFGKFEIIFSLIPKFSSIN